MTNARKEQKKVEKYVLIQIEEIIKNIIQSSTHLPRIRHGSGGGRPGGVT